MRYTLCLSLCLSVCLLKIPLCLVMLKTVGKQDQENGKMRFRLSQALSVVCLSVGLSLKNTCLSGHAKNSRITGPGKRKDEIQIKPDTLCLSVCRSVGLLKMLFCLVMIMLKTAGKQDQENGKMR